MVSLSTFLLLALASALASGVCAQDKSESHSRLETPFGLAVIAHSTGCWEIKNVLRDSKAAACHFRPLDLVCAVEGITASSLSSDSIASLPQTTKCRAVTVRKHSYASTLPFYSFFVTLAQVRHCNLPALNAFFCVFSTAVQLQLF